MSFLSPIITWIKAHKKVAIIAGLIVLALGGAFLSSRNKPASTEGTFTVVRTDLAQEVDVTGSVKAASTATLAFQRSGTVAHVYAREGTSIEPGQVIISLENADLVAALAAAQANADNAQANLDALLKGSRSEDVQVSEAALAVAAQALANDYSGAQSTLEDAYAKTDDATRVKLSGIYSTNGSSYSLTFSACSSQDTIDATWKRFLIDQTLIAWRMGLNQWDTLTSEQRDALIEKSMGYIGTARDLLETTNRLLTASCQIANASLDTYRANLTLARTNLNTVASNVSTLEQSIMSQKLAVEKARSELALKKAPPTPEAVAAQKATVASAQARVAEARAALAQTEIRSPLSGIVTNVDAETGELKTAGTPLVTVMSRNSFEIEANVVEADIAKLSVGNTADVTLDAYGDNAHFAARLYFIDPAETIIEGVPTYRVKLQFIKDDVRIKSGMTANIKMITATRTNVLAIPQRTILDQNNGTGLVTLLYKDGTATTTPIETGLRDSNGKIEILSGLSEGDTISTVAPLPQ